MLKRVSIQNFKSLKDVTLDLQKVNLLIGPNNSGKTNFLKAISNIYILVDESSESILSVADKKQEYAEVSFGILNQINETYYYYYITLYQEEKKNLEFVEFIGKTDQNLELEVKDVSDIMFLNQHFDTYNLSVNDDSIRTFIWYDKYRVDNPNLISNPHDFSIRKNENGYSAGNSLFRGALYQEYWKNINSEKKFILNDTRNPLSNLLIYRPDPNTLKVPKPLSATDILNEDCSNLVPFIFNIGQNQKRVLKQIERNLELSTGDIVSVSTPTVETIDGNMLKLKFFDKSDTEYWVDEVSEGVLYFLSLLCIINQPNPPKLLLLEEPEKGIHPRRIFEVIQFIFRLAEEKDVQVIMTTHSPIVVDMFKDMTESVFIFDKDEKGATHVKNLQRDIIEPETKKSRELGIEPHHYTDSLGDAWTVGFLGGVPK